MDGSLITTTRNTDLQSLGTGGQRAIHAWDQIVGYIGRTLSPAHAALLAEPNQDPDRGITDWYAQAQGAAVLLSSLAKAEREEVSATLAKLYGDIKGTSEQLKKSGREGERFLGEMVEMALVTPGQAYVYVVGKQPVLVAWGHTLAGASAAPELLIGRVASGPPGRAASRRPGEPPMTIVGPPTLTRDWGWRHLLAALLVAVLLLLMLSTLFFHFAPSGWLPLGNPQCVASPNDLRLQDEIRTVQQREGRLREEISRIALDLGNRRVACPPIVELPPPLPDVQRAERGGARTGRIQVILAWDDHDDLDLSIECPPGAGAPRINFNAKNACNGTLDIDQNQATPYVGDPVENIVFPNNPATGTYRIFVHKYDHRSGSPDRSPYRVTVRQEGQPDKVYTGTVGKQQLIEVGQFQVPPSR